jgi:hypothetical protein
MRGPWRQPRIILGRQFVARARAPAADGGASPMTARDIFLGIPLVLKALVLRPIVEGIIVQFEEREQRSQGPEIFRPYRYLWKRFHKQIVTPRPALWLFRGAPVLVPKCSNKSDIDEFIQAAAKLPAASESGRGRLIFALDPTMSRQAIWDIALYWPHCGGGGRE